MKAAVLTIALALPLAACGSRPAVDERNASVEEVSEKVREASDDGDLIRPGEWVSTVTIEDMAMPGVPPGVAEQMKSSVAQAQTSRTCITPAQAEKPGPGLFAGNDACRYDHFTMGGGKIDAQMRCKAGGGTQVMEMAGTYSRDSYTMRMTSRSEEGGPSDGIVMKMKVEAKRVGECPAAKEG